MPARTLKPYVLELNLAPQMGGDEQSVRALDARPVCAAFSFSLSFSLCVFVLLCASVCLSLYVLGSTHSLVVWVVLNPTTWCHLLAWFG